MTKGTAFWQAALICAGLLTTGFSAAAGLYKWVDANGNVQYSQDPPPQGKFESIAPPAPAAESTPSGQTSEQAQPDATKPPPAVEDTTAKQEATINKMNCEAGRKNLDVYNRHRRFVDEKGDVVTLDDNERAAKIKEAQEMIKKYCK